MKTIDEKVKEIEKVVNGKTTTAFRKGVEFAQRWISVEEELPEDMEWILVKNDYSYATMKIAGDIDAAFFRNNFTHWRPIERI